MSTSAEALVLKSLAVALGELRREAPARQTPAGREIQTDRRGALQGVHGGDRLASRCKSLLTQQLGERHDAGPL